MCKFSVENNVIDVQEINYVYLKHNGKLRFTKFKQNLNNYARHSFKYIPVTEVYSSRFKELFHENTI